MSDTARIPCDDEQQSAEEKLVREVLHHSLTQAREVSASERAKLAAHDEKWKHNKFAYMMRPMDLDPDVLFRWYVDQALGKLSLMHAVKNYKP